VITTDYLTNNQSIKNIVLTSDIKNVKMRTKLCIILGKKVMINNNNFDCLIFQHFLLIYSTQYTVKEVYFVYTINIPN
jgi:hypothetical protein